MTANAALLATHRAALVGHCYRMLGSIADADDAVQETMVRALRGLERFEEKSSLRTWLTRIATNVCLDALSARSRRTRPLEDGPRGTVDDELEARPRTHWLEPVPDALSIPSDADPQASVALRQSIRLAFVAALQTLPPKQRAALLLADVLGWSAAETAETLEMSVASVNSALQRARATLAEREVKNTEASLSDPQRALVDQFVEAFERYDIAALAKLLHEDVVMSMPPFTLWLRGPEAVHAWMTGRGAACAGSKLVATRANGLPAFAQYKPTPEGGYHAWALVVLEPGASSIETMTFFLDVETIFPKFGLPLDL